MTASSITIRSAAPADIKQINQLIEAAVMTWDLPDRVKRLSLPSYFYTEVDFDHFELIVAILKNKIVAVAAYEQADPADLPNSNTGLLLHGIYVHPDHQKQKIGNLLLNEVEKVIKDKKLDGLLVKAQKDAVPFFIKYGMQALEIKNPDKDYKNRFWKSL